FIDIADDDAIYLVQELFVCPRFVRSLDVVGSVCSCYQSVKVLQLNEIFVEQNVVKLWSCLELIESLTLTLCSLDFDDMGEADDAFANLRENLLGGSIGRY
ncbi:hypothetical protein LINPERPRIM_LOCUS9027, partial [Linum perenne]